MSNLKSIRIPAAQRLSRAIAAWLTLLAALLLLTACGSTTTAPAGSSTLPTQDVPAWTGDGWRTDLETGDAAGEVAEATQLVLADGSTATLEELAVVPTHVVYSREAGVAPPMPPCGRRRL
jgi:hypothetical protein